MNTRKLFQIAGVTVAYIVSARLGFLLAIEPGNITPVWPPSGISLAAALIFGNHALVGVFFGSVLINIWSMTGASHDAFWALFLVSAGIAVGSTAQAWLGSMVVRRFIGIDALVGSVKGVLKFFCCQTAVCTIAASAGVLSLYFGKQIDFDRLGYSWWTWWSGDLSGSLVIVPFFLAWKKPIQLDALRLLEACLFITALAFMSWLIFGYDSSSFLTLPFIVYAAVRFGPRGVTGAVIALSVISIVKTAEGTGPFAESSINQGLILLQTYLATITMTGLALSASLWEQRRTREVLSRRESELRDLLAGANKTLKMATDQMTDEEISWTGWLSKLFGPRHAQVSNSLHFFESLVESTGDAVIGKDLQGRIISWNSGAQKIYGYTEKEIKGKSMLLLIPKDRQEEFPGIMKQIKEGRRIENFETVRVCKDGRLIAVSLTISPISVPERGIVGASIIARDVTEHKAVLQRQALQYAVALVLTQSRALSELFSKFVQILCTTLDWDLGAVWLVNKDIHELHCVKSWSIETAVFSELKRQLRSKIYAKGSGLPGQVWEADKPLWISELKSYPEFRDLCKEEEELNSALAFPLHMRGSVTGVAVFFSRKNRPIDEKLLQMLTTVGHQIGQFMEHRELEKQRVEYLGALEQKNEELAKREKIMRSLLEDIHASNISLEHQQKFLQQINSRLAQLSLLKDEFVATVSHELRTPLTSIKEGLALVLDRALGEINPEQEDFLRTVDQSADRLTELINNLLDIAKIEAGRLRLSRRRVAVTDLIRNTVQNYKIIAGKRTIELPERSSSDVFADPDRITQVLGNLFSNAVKFTAEDGHIRFEVENKGSEVWVSVEDDGCGISEEDMPKLFEKFSQVGAHVARPQGTGLGLALCRELVEIHQGKIWVHSVPGKSSRFTFSLPVYTPQTDLDHHFRKTAEAAGKNAKVALVVLDAEPFYRAFSTDTPAGGENWQEQWAEMVKQAVTSPDSVVRMERQKLVVISILGKEGIEPILRVLKNRVDQWTQRYGFYNGVNHIYLGYAICPDQGVDPQILFERALSGLNQLSLAGRSIP